MMIEIDYRTASITDWLTELCIRRGGSFAVLVSRMLLVIMIHADRGARSFSPSDNFMMATDANTLFQAFFGLVLDPNGILFVSSSFIVWSMSVSCLPTERTFRSLS
jgi:hypothetical protein